MNPEQTELLPAPPVALNWLVGELHRAHGWLFASELLRRFGVSEKLSNTEEYKRVIRRLASASPLIVSGQKGYCHMEWATAEEQTHFFAALRSQARSLIRRELRGRKVAHALIG